MDELPLTFERSLRLEARNPDRNIHRRYSITALPDLFEHIIVTLEWGRIGASTGQTRTLSFESREGADRFLRTVLNRRRSSVRRIGTPYQVVASD